HLARLGSSAPTSARAVAKRHGPGSRRSSMNVRFRFRSGTAAWLVVIMTIAPGATWSEQDGDSELRKELDAVKKQLRRVEEQMKKQEELIRKLTAERPAAVPTAPPPAVATEEEQRKAEELKRKIEED